jgi:CheY-like chemotaxis protein
MTELKRVMCVEDDPDIRLILKFSLERLGGFSLCLCSDGFDALDKVESFQPQLVLLDVMMPKLSGPQTLKKLRTLEVMRGVPVVFLTAKAMRNEVEALLEHGSTGIIVKPFDPVTLPKDVLIYWQHGRG